MIYTGYFANIRNYPKHIVPVSIARSTPRWIKCPVYLKLAPPMSLVSEYKASSKSPKDEARYIDIYVREVLDQLHPLVVYSELMTLTESEDIVICCYETSEAFCHRHIAGGWLSQVTNIKEL